MRAVAVCVVLWCATWSGAAMALSLGGYQNALVELLLQKVSVPGHFEVQARKIEEEGVGNVKLSGLTIADSKGVWFRAELLRFAWSPSHLLTGEARIEQIDLRGASFERAPVVPAGENSAPDEPAAGGPSGWPRAPLAIEVAAITITNMRISEAVLPGGIVFDAKGAMRDRGDIQSLQLGMQRIDDIKGSIDVSYLKRFDTGNLDLRLGASEAAGGLVAKLTGLPADVPLVVAANATGPASGLTGGLRLELTDYLSAQGSLSAAWASRIAGELSLELVSGARLDPALADALGANPRLDVALAEGADGIVQIERGALTGSALTARISGTYDRTAAAADIRLGVEVADAEARRLDRLLAPLRISGGGLQARFSGPLSDWQLVGKGELAGPSADAFRARRASVSFEIGARDQTPQGATRYAVMLDAGIEAPQGPSKALSDALGPRVQLSVRGSGPRARFKLASLALQAQGLKAQASGHLGITEAGFTPELEYTFSVPDIGVLAALAAQDASGTATGKGRLHAPGGVVTLAGRVTARAARAAGRDLGTVALAHTLKLAATPHGNFALTMDGGRLAKVRASAAFRAEQKGLRLAKLKLAGPGVVASGSAYLPSGGGLPTANLAFQADDLAALGRGLELPLEGQGRGQLELAARNRGTARLDARFDALRFDGTRIGSVSLDARVTALNGRPRADLRAEFGAGSVGSVSLDSLILSAAGPLADLPWTLAGAGKHGEKPLSVRAEGGLAWAGSGRGALRLSSLVATYAAESVALRSPAELAYDAGALRTVSPLHLALPDESHLDAEFTLEHGAMRATAKARRVPLRLAALFAAVPIASGRLDLDLAMDSSRTAPSLDLRLLTDDIRIDGVPDDAGSLRAEGTARWRGKQLEVSGRLDGPFEAPLLAKATLDLVPGAGPVPVVPADAALDAEIEWRGEIEPVYALLPLPDHLLSGDVVMAVRGRGKLAAPRLSGTMTLRGGRYENLVAGTIVDAMALDTSFDDEGRVRFSLRGTDEGDGRIEVDGELTNPGVEMALDVKAVVRSALLVRLDNALARASADIRAKGTLAQMDVAGRIEVHRAELQLTDPNLGNVPDLGPVVNIDEAAEEERAARRRAAVPVSLDVTIAMPGEIFVRGRGLASEWRGELFVKGTAAAPDISGRVESKRGNFDLAGKNFKLVRGLVLFDGARGIDPSLDVRLERETGGITGAVLVSGRASAPELGFAATPAVPEDEVLARVLFGRSRQSLSASEALQLAGAVQTLTSGGSTVMDRARSALGLDVLRLDSGDGEGSSMGSLEVGRYVRQGVYVGARQALDGGGSAVVVEVEILDNVVIEGDVNQNAESGVGVSWRKDF